MEWDDWPPRGFKWEPVGRNGLSVALQEGVSWFCGKDGRTSCMTFATAHDLVEWIEEHDTHGVGNAEQVTPAAKTDARRRGWSQAKEGWPHESSGTGVRRSRSPERFE